MKCTWCRESIRESKDGWTADGLIHCENSKNGRHEPEPTEAAPSTDCVKDFGGYPMGTYKGKLFDVTRPEMGKGWSLQETLVNVSQLLSGWHQDGTAWSEWDELVRQNVSRHLVAHKPEPIIECPQCGGDPCKDGCTAWDDKTGDVLLRMTASASYWMHPKSEAFARFKADAEIISRHFQRAAASGTESAPATAHMLAQVALRTGRKPNESIFDYQPRLEAALMAALKSQPSSLTQAGPDKAMLKVTTGVTLSVERYNELVSLESRAKEWKYCGQEKSDELKTLLQMVAMSLVGHLGEKEDQRTFREIAAADKYQEGALTAVIVVLGAVIRPLSLPSLVADYGAAQSQKSGGE